MRLSLISLFMTPWAVGCGDAKVKNNDTGTQAEIDNADSNDEDTESDDDDTGSEDEDTGSDDDTGIVTTDCFNLSESVASYDMDADGIIDSDIYWSYTYDERDHQTSFTEQYDAGSDGVMDMIYVETDDYEYDEAGNTIRLLSGSDSDGDGISDRSSEYTWLYEDGLVHQYQVKEDSHGDGVWEKTEVTDYTYNDAGDVTEQAVESLNDEYPDRSYQSDTTYEYDIGGRLIEIQAETDNAMDGTIDEFGRSEWVYDGDLLMEEAHTHDADGDGVWDTRIQQLYTYDDDERLTLYSRTFDETGDGVAESTMQFRYTYDAEDRVTEEESLFDTDGDGLWDQSMALSTTYDDDGNTTVKHYSEDEDYDGYPDSMTTEFFTFDTEGRILEQRSEADFDGDGDADRVVTDIYEYDEAGQLIVQTQHDVFIATDDPGDNRTSVSTYTYDVYGNPTHAAHEIDRGSDGIIDNFFYTSSVWVPCHSDETTPACGEPS